MAYARIQLKSGREIHMGFDETVGLYNFFIYAKHLTGAEKLKEVFEDGLNCNTQTEYFLNLAASLGPEELGELQAIGFYNPKAPQK